MKTMLWLVLGAMLTTQYAETIQQYPQSTVDHCLAFPTVLPSGKSGAYIAESIFLLNSKEYDLSTNSAYQAFSLDSNLWEAQFLIKTNQRKDRAISLQENKSNSRRPDKKLNAVIPYITERNGIKSLFLKSILQKADFPLSSPSDTVVAWAINHKAAVYCYSTSASSHSGDALLHIATLKGTRKRSIKTGRIVNSACFSPDGIWLYYSASSSVKDSSTDLFKTKLWDESNDTVVQWKNSNEAIEDISPDGTLLLFSSNRDGNEKLYLSNSCGDDPICIGSDNASYSKAKFSPDCKKIALLSDRNNFGGKLDLWVYERGVSPMVSITQQSDVEEFCWTHDSKKIIYSSGVTIKDLNCIDLHTAIRTKLIQKENKNYSELQPTTARFGKQEKVVFVKKYLDNRQEVYWVTTYGTLEQKILGGSGFFSLK